MGDVKPVAQNVRIVRCDCCGEEVLAVERDGKLVITAHKHGKKHFAVINMDNGKEGD